MSLPLIAFSTSADALWETPLRKKWRAASGEPSFPRWSSLRSADKKDMFHDIALSLAHIGIVVRSLYKRIPVARLMEMQKYSIEHVVPRSKINGRLPGAAEDDPRGWWTADRDTNSRRGNLPLALWPDPVDAGIRLRPVRSVDGVKHFFPPNDRRPMVARIWLFVRFNYRHDNVFAAPSDAQKAHAEDICEFAKVGISAQEIEMNRRFQQRYGVSNPLIEDSSYLDDPGFRFACFH